jgi:transcriptional regulator with XRE-family HTH domain
MESLRQLAVIRKARGLSQQKLADAAGFTQVYISDLELGRRPTEPSHVLRLAAILDVAPSTLSASDVQITITSPSGNVAVRHE